MNVEVGMSRQEVLTILGQPQRQETYGSTEFLIYSNDGSSNVALINFTPIAVVEGRVTGIGRQLYDAVAHAKERADRSDDQNK
jgi:outer membrane protein assembly factor BamE (lipoprotein component of BamABCDE complex)